MAKRGFFDKDGMIHGRRAKQADAPLRVSDDPLKNMRLNILIKNYLCRRKYSDCVRKGTCEMLHRCRYGQKYLELVKKDGK